MLGLLCAFVCAGGASAEGEPDPIARWQALTAEAEAHQEAQRFAEADDAFARAAKAARAGGLHPTCERDSLYGRIDCLALLCDYPAIRDVSLRMLEVQRSLLAEAESEGDATAIREARLDLADTFMDIGYLQTHLGDLHGAVERLHAAFAIADAVGSDKHVADALARLANAEAVRGRLAPALIAAEAAEARYRAFGDALSLVEVLQVIGNVHLALRDEARARAACDEAQKLLDGMDDPPLRNRVELLGRRSALHVRAKEYSAAIRTREAARDALVEIGEREAAGLLQVELAGIEILRGQPDAALARLADTVVTDAPGAQLAVAASIERGRALKRLGRHEEAIDLLDQAIESAHALGLLRAECRAQEVLADALLAAGHAEPAARAVVASLDIVDSMARRLTPFGERGVREGRNSLFQIAENVGMAQADPAAAYAIVERARASALIHRLGGADGLLEHAGRLVQESVAGARDDLVRARDRLAQARAIGRIKGIREARDVHTAAQDGYARALERARRETLLPLRELFDEPVAADAAADADAEPPPDRRALFRVAALQESLREGDAFVLYAHAGDELQALVVTSKDIQHRTLGDAEAVRAASEKLRAQFESAAELAGASKLSRGPSFDGDTVEQLRRFLVTRLRLPDDTTHIFLSPATGLATVPFGLLVALERDVTLVPSGTAYHLLAAEAAQRGTGVIALGDPQHGRSRPLEGGTDTVALRSPTGARGFTPLPRTRDEVEAITGPEDVSLLGTEATEDGLLEHLGTRPRWRSLHLACHGVCDPLQPEWSSLVLTPTGRSDGFLSVLEVLGMRIQTDAVVLSACETGLGEEQWGEGLLSLATAFMSAGSPRVVASLWEVDSEATSELVQRFYARWNPTSGEAGVPAAQALREAQQHIRTARSGKWAHPYYWAGWVLWGRSD